MVEIMPCGRLIETSRLEEEKREKEREGGEEEREIIGYNFHGAFSN